MKIFAFTDVHGSSRALERIIEAVRKHKPDIIAGLGDFTIFGDGLHEFLAVLDKEQVRSLMIHGNHESHEELKEAGSGLIHIECMHRRYYIVDDYIFFGFGGGGLRHDNPDLFELEKSWSKLIKKNPEKKVILLTHAPPYGHVDLVDDDHCGNKSVTRWIKKYRPHLALFGHLHENAEKKSKLGRTRLINPGPYGMLIEI